jgi:hypothetical protein
MKRLGALIFAAVLWAGAALAQAVGPISPAATLAVTTGGTWQVLFAANDNRKTLWIENYCSATTQGIVTAESVFVYFLPPNTAAPTTASGPSLGAFELAACGSQVFTGSYMTRQTVYILGATTAHQFAAWQTQ